jgi:hypothetical protein
MISRALSELRQGLRLQICKRQLTQRKQPIIEEVRHVPYIFLSYLRSSNTLARRGDLRTRGSTGPVGNRQNSI